MREVCIHSIGKVLIDLTSRAPSAFSATISLDVRPFNAARDLVTPARLVSGLGSICALVASIRISAAPIDTFQRLRHLDPICSENDDLTLGSLVFRAGDCVGTEISHKISPHLRTSGIGYDYGVTSCYQMTAMLRNGIRLLIDRSLNLYLST